MPSLSIAKKAVIAVAAAATFASVWALPAAANPIEDFFRSFSTPGTYAGGGASWDFRRQTVGFRTKEKAGTVIIDTRSKFLFYVLGDGQAIRYGVGVGRDRLRLARHGPCRPQGRMAGLDSAEGDDRARSASAATSFPTYMAGGEGNPLGARAMYLYNGGGDTGYRIHGTSEPWTIGHNVSSGCIRLVNDDVIDLYNRVRVGAKVIVL